ncbi:MAG: hypothetical protein EOO61_12710 [Hymenobacter sp.]|nr:MAG: hypothetical protein EOO61_12710 [Hymenobacter sp.]
MNPLKYAAVFLTTFFLNFISAVVFGQIQIQGTVFDATQKNPLENVVVSSSKGRNTITDSSGNYTITVQPDDSIYFSYGGKGTKKYLVKEITYPYAFNMSLKVKQQNVLPNVTVIARSYRQDSAENRADYAKAFNYRKPNPLNTINSNDGVTGVDPGSIIDLFRTKHNRRIQSLQTRLLDQEQDKYVAYRFNKAVIKKLTGLQGRALDTFMVLYRPRYEFVQACNDLELYQYIWLSGKQYVATYARRPK